MTNNPTPEQMMKERAMDVDEIVRGLSEGQKRALVGLSDQFSKPPIGTAYWAGTLLYGEKLTKFRYANPPENKRLYCLTETGLAVRARLLEQGHG